MENKNSLFKKIDNFFYHYKVHVLVGALILIFIATFAYSIISNMLEERKIAKEPTALQVLMFGDYKIGNQLPLLEANLRDAFPDWDKVNIIIEYVPSDTNSYEDISAMQRGTLTLYSEKPDIYIFDRHEYDKFIEPGSFIKLDAHFTDNESLIKAKKENDTEAHAYAIDITDSNLFSNLEINSIEKIALISQTSERQANALEFIESALEK